MSFKNEIKDDLKRFIDPLKQDIRNVKDDIADAIYVSEHNEEFKEEGKKGGCFPKVLLYGILIYLACVVLVKCDGNGRKIERSNSTMQASIETTIGLSEMQESPIQSIGVYETPTETQEASTGASLGKIMEVRDYHDGVAWVQSEISNVIKWCCCDMEGNILFSLDPESTPTTYFANGVAIVDENKIVNKTGDIVWSLERDGVNAGNYLWGEGSVESVDIRYVYVDEFYGYTLVHYEVDCFEYTGEMTGVVDVDGTWRLEPEKNLTVIGEERNGVYYLGSGENGDRYYDIVANEFLSGVELCDRDDNYKFEEHNGLIYKEKQDPDNNFIQLPGFYDAEDNLVIDLSNYYVDTEDGEPEFNDGYAILNIENEQGGSYYTIIDTTGKEMFAPQKRVRHGELSCGYYWVYGIGYLNVHGERAFDKDFTFGTTFSEGRAFVNVKEGDDYNTYCIDTTGDIVY